MHYDQSWMGYGVIGGLEAGAITTLAAFVLYFVLHVLVRRQGWSPLKKMAIAYLLAIFLTASGDMWDLFYFNYGRIDSIQLLKVKLAQLHDPDGLGLRVGFELLGGLIGATVGWLVLGGDWRSLFRGDD